MKIIVKLILFGVLFSCSREQKTTIKISNLSEKKAVSISKDKGTNNISATKEMAGKNYESDLIYFKKLMKKYEESSQFFSVNKFGPQVVKGLKGTVLYVNPADFETIDGKEPFDSIKIELKELLSTNELLRSGAQTVSNGKLLVSGGSYYIAATSNGKKLKLKSGRTLRAEFPRTTNEDMLVYYGKATGNVMNWNTANQIFPVRPYLREKSLDTLGTALYSRSDKRYVNLTKHGNVYRGSDTIEMSEIEYNEYKDQITAENKLIKAHNQLAEKLYAPVDLNNLGWSNVDRPINNANAISLFIKLEGANDVKMANAYIVFKQMNSLIQSFYFSSKNKTFYFRNLPPDSEMTVIAYSINNGKILCCRKDFTIKDSNSLKINLQETSETGFKNMIAFK